VLVACAANEEFLAPVSAMLHSLGQAVDGAVEVVLLHDEDLSHEGRSRVERTVRDTGGTLRFVAVPAERLAAFPSGRFPRTIWARALLPELLPDAARVLYLDADTIVLDSPAPLWSTDLGDAPFAAVANPLYPFMDDWPRERLGIDDIRQYVNSGVLLLNLDQLRREDAPGRLLAFARAHPENPCPDQDALSALFGARHASLHPRWNAQVTLWDLRMDQMPFTEAEVHEARRDPAIVHFIGPFKPWHYLCRHPYADRYFAHLAATPWPAPAIEGRTPVNRVLRRLSPTTVDRWFRRQAARAASRP
jgi:lipopolysaccharide biosynthesis glycosyltransferase